MESRILGFQDGICSILLTPVFLSFRFYAWIMLHEKDPPELNALSTTSPLLQLTKHEQDFPPENRRSPGWTSEL
jgi:hypothetical protein